MAAGRIEERLQQRVLVIRKKLDVVAAPRCTDVKRLVAGRFLCRRGIDDQQHAVDRLALRGVGRLGVAVTKLPERRGDDAAIGQTDGTVAMQRFHLHNLAVVHATSGTGADIGPQPKTVADRDGNGAWDEYAEVAGVILHLDREHVAVALLHQEKIILRAEDGNGFARADRRAAAVENQHVTTLVKFELVALGYGPPERVKDLECGIVASEQATLPQFAPNGLGGQLCLAMRYTHRQARLLGLLR